MPNDYSKLWKPNRSTVFSTISLLIGLLLPIVCAEIAFQILPTNGGLMARAVDEKNPIFRFTPNRTLTWSRGWDFSIANRIRVNNAGFVNDQDYDKTDESPLLAVVGDSYVEAAMVPYGETIQGRLAKQLEPDGRVYSFAASGAPLSQYLIWARYAREVWHAQKLVIVVISNDFDESLSEYKQGPGFHHYVRDASGNLKLSRVDYHPNPLRNIIRLSALARYLVFNIQIRERIRLLLAAEWQLISNAYAQTYIGNTAADASEKRIRDSRDAIAAFLRDLETFAGWSPEDVVFVVDGIRYPKNREAYAGSYFVLMRQHFLMAAGEAGYEAIDLDPKFFTYHEKTKSRFEFATDSHWNGTAHGIAASAIAESNTLKHWPQ